MNTLTKDQFTQFQLASQHGVDTAYLTPDLTADQMREKRLALESGYDPAMFTADISAEKMHSIRSFLDLGVDVDMQFIHTYSEEQLREIQLGEKYGLNTSVYQYPYLDATQMRSMRLRLLSEKLIQYIKYQAVNVLHKIEDKLVPTPVVNNISDDEKLRAAVISVLKEMDFTDAISIEDVKNKLEKVIDNSNKIDPAQDIISDDVEKPLSYKNVDGQSVEVIDSYTFLQKRIFALLKFDDHNYAIVNNLKVENDAVTYDDSENYSSLIMASKAYQSLVIEAQMKEKNISNPDLFHNLNEAEFVVMAMSDMYTDEMRLAFVQDHPEEIRQSIVEFLAETEEVPEIKTAAQQILSSRAEASKEQAAQTKKTLETAQSKDTPSAVLRAIAEKSKDEEVLNAVLKNPNCSTSTMYYLKENSTISEAAQAAISERMSNDKWESIEVDRSLMVRDFPSHQLDKNKQPIMLTLIKLPEHNSIGLGATMVVPKNSIKDMPEKTDKVSLSINTDRNFTIKCDKSDTILSGKDVIKELNSGKGKSLDDRLKKATQKKESPKKEKTKETTKSKSKSKKKDESEITK